MFATVPSPRPWLRLSGVVNGILFEPSGVAYDVDLSHGSPRNRSRVAPRSPSQSAPQTDCSPNQAFDRQLIPGPAIVQGSGCSSHGYSDGRRRQHGPNQSLRDDGGLPGGNGSVHSRVNQIDNVVRIRFYRVIGCHQFFPSTAQMSFGRRRECLPTLVQPHAVCTAPHANFSFPLCRMPSQVIAVRAVCQPCNIIFVAPARHFIGN